MAARAGLRLWGLCVAGVRGMRGQVRLVVALAARGEGQEIGLVRLTAARQAPARPACGYDDRRSTIASGCARGEA